MATVILYKNTHVQYIHVSLLHENILILQPKILRNTSNMGYSLVILWYINKKKSTWFAAGDGVSSNLAKMSSSALGSAAVSCSLGPVVVVVVVVAGVTVAWTAGCCPVWGCWMKQKQNQTWITYWYTTIHYISHYPCLNEHYKYTQT